MHKEVKRTFPPSPSNEISREYYNSLLGQINSGSLKSAVCKKEDPRFNQASYYLITIP